MNNLEADLIACDREDVKTGGLKAFVRLAWPQVYPSSPFLDNWHIGLMCEHFQACFRGEISELVVNLPPGGSKSSVTSVFFPAYGWTQEPARSWIYAAYGQKIVRRDASFWRTLLLSEWYRKRWGDLFEIPNVTAVDMIENNRGGFRLGTTPGAEVTGFHANYQVIDDPNKPEELTKVGLQGVQDWLNRTMASRWRRPPEVNSLICIMQRLHCDDLSQMLIDRGAVHICLPANYDPARRTVTKWGSDPRTKPRELLDPVRLPQKLIDSLRTRLGPMNAAAQLDQSPVPEGGAVFKKAHLRFWSTNPKSVLNGINLLDGEGTKCPCVFLPASYDDVIDSWDMAFKDEETSDYVCGQKWARVGPGFYLLRQKHGHADFGTSCRWVLELAGDDPRSTVRLIEDKANGTAIVQVLSEKVPGVIAVDPRGGKYSRASACSGLCEAGNVFLPDPTMPGFEWVASLLIPEVLAFPRAKKDDQVDTLTQGLLYLQENTNYLAAAMAVVRKELGIQDT